MSSKHEKLYLIYILWLLFFISLTNQFYDFKEIVSINQTDSISYMAIAKFAPEYSSEIMPYHHAQRVFIPYLIGIISKILNFDPFLIFRIFTYLTILIIVVLHYLITKILKVDIYFSILSISLLILNPYLIRYFLAVPTMVNDAFFILSIYLFLLAMMVKNKLMLFGVTLSLISRQNGIFLFISHIVYRIINNKHKFYKDKNLIFSLILILLLSSIANNYATKVSASSFNFVHVYGIFTWVINEFDFSYFIKWIMLPLYSYLPLIFVFLAYRKINITDKNNLKQFFIVIFIFLSIVGVAYLPGPTMAGRNIIRQTTLAYPAILIGILWFSTSPMKKYNISFFLTLIGLLHLWSFHPSYSIFTLFEVLRNYLI